MSKVVFTKADDASRRSEIKQALDKLREFQADDPEAFIATIVAMFFSGTPIRVAEIRGAWVAGDLKGLIQSSHSYRGSCLSIGATRLAETCDIVESEARAGKQSDESHIREIETESALVIEELRKLTQR